MIMQLCFAVGVQEIHGIKELIEATNIKYLGLIWDFENPMSKQSRQGSEMIAEIFRKIGYPETAELGV